MEKPQVQPSKPRVRSQHCGKRGNAENGLQNQKFSQQIKQGTQGCEIITDLERSNSISCTKLTPVKQGARLRRVREGLGERKTHRQKIWR